MTTTALKTFTQQKLYFLKTTIIVLIKKYFYENKKIQKW